MFPELQKGKKNMFNNRGGGKRALSIYSILTILVITSISGGCMFENPPRGLRLWDWGKDVASVAVIIGSSSFRAWSNSSKTDRYLHQETILYIDGVKVIDTYCPNCAVGWAEVTPGHHNILIDIFLPQVNLGQGLQKAWTYHTTQAIEMDAEASRIYKIIPNVSLIPIPTEVLRKVAKEGGEVRNFNVRLEVIEEVDYKYDSATGFANHSTNSELSFKLHDGKEQYEQVIILKKYNVPQKLDSMLR